MTRWGADAERLRRLREADPDANLAERWAWLQANAPDLAASMPFVPLVQSRGWAVGGTARTACTVGLLYRTGHPELVLDCPSVASAADTNSLRAAADALAHRVAAGARPGVGDRVRLEGERVTWSAVVRAVGARALRAFPCTAILRFEEVFSDAVHDPAAPPVLWLAVRRARRSGPPGR